MLGLDIWSVIVLAVGVISVLGMFAYMATGHGVRHNEDHARDYFDAHGHWPDQTPQDVIAQRAAADQWMRVRDAEPDVDGLV